MVKVSLIYIILFFGFTTQSNQNDIIKWSIDRKLTWSDYEAFLEKNTPIGAASSVGIIYEIITKSYENCLLEVYAGFIRKRSSVWKEKATDSLLIHEQGHFDLVEVYARKMRKAIINKQYKFNGTNFEEEIKKVLDLYADSLSKMQNSYDNETNYSQKFDKQIQWNKYINEELKKLKKYSKTYINISFNFSN